MSKRTIDGSTRGRLRHKDVDAVRARVAADVRTARVRVNAIAPEEPPMVLIKEALDDLRYIEPKRAADRVIACLNELFLRVNNMEHMHAPEHDVAKKKKR